ncbi:BACON domain-containing protein [Bacteroides sp. 51]|uniref:BACON domain-containing protein n=1 Tax=Bacteroides sp. 51 TaxID=2302938 RepID=UPI0013D7549F|nr:BACON domain-containing protein [Bacteroides sp. 51]NDV81903.1 hypothetical protein [Bacteroides sp. 51]
MKTIFNISIFIAILSLFSSCNDDDSSDAFIVMGERTVTINKDGGNISIPVSTTVAYSVTPVDPWCTISGKNAIGFDIVVEFNESVQQRSTDVVIAAPGFDPVTIVVTQDKGVPFFTIEDAQKKKSFIKEGETHTVTFKTNADYTATSSEEWLSVGNITSTSFKLTAEDNTSPGARTAKVTVKSEGIPDVIIEITQEGPPPTWKLENGWFTDGWGNWEVTGYEDMFILTSDAYMPDKVLGVPTPTGAKYITRANLGQTPTEGRVLQTITEIPDGNYILYCRFAGSSLNASDELSLIAVVNGTETKQRITATSSWQQHSMPITVSGGTCKVGIYANWVGGGSSGMTMKAIDFQLIAN